MVRQQTCPSLPFCRRFVAATSGALYEEHGAAEKAGSGDGEQHRNSVVAVDSDICERRSPRRRATR